MFWPFPPTGKPMTSLFSIAPNTYPKETNTHTIHVHMFMHISTYTVNDLNMVENSGQKDLNKAYVILLFHCYRKASFDSRGQTG